MTQVVRRAFALLDPGLRRRWLAQAPLVSLAALVEAAGALAILALLRVIVAPDEAARLPLVAGLLPHAESPALAVALLALTVGGFYVARAAFLVATEWVKSGTTAATAVALAERTFRRILRAEYQFHLGRRPGDLVTDVMQSSERVSRAALASAVSILAEATTALALLVVLLVAAPLATLGAVALVLVLVAVPARVLGSYWTRWAELERDSEAAVLDTLEQGLGGIKAVLVAGRQAPFEERLRRGVAALGRVRRLRSTLDAAIRLGLETGLLVTLIAVVMLVATRAGEGASAISVLGLFGYAGFRMVPSANRIVLHLGSMKTGEVALARLEELLASATPASAGESGQACLPLRRDIVCEDVSFAYRGASEAALAGVSLAIGCGESIGVVGPTGSGKSTLVDLLLGLLAPTSGRVLVDGEDLRGRERGWQSQVGYVPQDPFLLDDTLRRNVAFGIDDADIDEDRLARALDSARLTEVVASLERGVDTPLGRRGSRLSGGQRQRVAIARALYLDPPVLVFDEATAALDPATEREVTEAIRTLHGTRTMFVIAHRLSTVRSCDRIVFLREGRVAAVGCYDELLAREDFRAFAAAEPQAGSAPGC